MGERGAPSGVCEWCGTWVFGLESDHIVPLDWYGPNDTSNLQWLCKSCHVMKSGWERRHRRWTRYWHDDSARPEWNDAAKAECLAHRQKRLQDQADRAAKKLAETLKEIRRAALRKEILGEDWLDQFDNWETLTDQEKNDWEANWQEWREIEALVDAEE